MNTLPPSALSPALSSTAARAGDAPPGRAEIERTARDFEAAFLAEALGHMGLDAAQGVQGAAPFASFVNRAYAERLVESGGLGLAENIVRSLAARTTDTP